MNGYKLILSAVLASSCLIFSYPASACDGIALEARQAGSDSYDPNATVPHFAQLELNLIKGERDTSCVGIPIEIVSVSGSGIRDFADGTAILRGKTPTSTAQLATITEQRIVLTQAGQSVLISSGKLTLDFSSLAAGNFLPSGRYINLLEVKIKGESATRFQVEMNVQPTFRLFGDASDGRGIISFGVLKDNAEATSNFVYQANAIVSVAAKSDNGGRLIHERGDGFGAIDYTTFINGERISSDGNQIIQINVNRVGTQQIGRVLVKVGNVGQPFAGRYSDVLTIMFSAS